MLVLFVLGLGVGAILFGGYILYRDHLDARSADAGITPVDDPYSEDDGLQHDTWEEHWGLR